MFKKYLSSFLFCAAATAVLIPGMALNADSQVEINKTNFPDDDFRGYVSGKFDEDEDGKLSSAEIKAVDDITLDNLFVHVKNLKGVEFFTEVKHICCSFNDISELDLSKNTKLTKLECECCKLKKLDLTANTELTELDCSYNKLTSLDLSRNIKLNTLDCSWNKLTSLDTSPNINLEALACRGNEHIKLDFSKNINLFSIVCRECGLKELDLSKNTKLEYLECSDNQITGLDLTNNQKINDIYAYSNDLTSVNLSGCTNLDLVYIQYNKLTDIDIGDWKAIRELDLQGNNIAFLDISKCQRLVEAVVEGDEHVENNGTYFDIWSKDVRLVVDGNTQIITETTEISEDNTSSIQLPCGALSKISIKNIDDQKNVKWKSSAPSIVTVNENGILKGVKAGKAELTATVDGKEYKCKVSSLYKDVKDSSKFWYTPTYALTETGVVKGYDNQTKFKPANKCTRAQMVTFIWRLAGSPEPETKECKFSDVKKSDYFYKACLWGNEKGIVEGYKDGTFGPKIVCARRHAVTFLWRLAGKPEPAGDKTKFTDVFKDIDENDYFFKATIWATEQKIVAGYDDNTFRPDGDCLRRQMVTFLYKYDKNVGVKK